MKIIKNDNLKKVKFETINEGDAFMYLGSCYIKVQCFALNKINAVLLFNGATFSF